jgi:hypothetical protein
LSTASFSPYRLVRSRTSIMQLLPCASSEIAGQLGIAGELQRPGLS